MPAPNETAAVAAAALTSRLDCDDDTILDGRAAILAELVVGAYAAGRADERRRIHELAAAAPTTRVLYAALMAEAIGGTP